MIRIEGKRTMETSIQMKLSNRSASQILPPKKQLSIDREKYFGLIRSKPGRKSLPCVSKRLSPMMDPMMDPMIFFLPANRVR